jgi:hypothetical protein
MSANNPVQIDQSAPHSTGRSWTPADNHRRGPFMNYQQPTVQGVTEDLETAYVEVAATLQTQGPVVAADQMRRLADEMEIKARNNLRR